MYSREFKVDLKLNNLQDIFKRKRVFYIPISKRTLPPLTITPQDQKLAVQSLRFKIALGTNSGYRFIFMDECTFSPNRWNNMAFQKKEDKMITRKWRNEGLVCVCGAISREDGKVTFLYDAEKKALNGDHICIML